MLAFLCGVTGHLLYNRETLNRQFKSGYLTHKFLVIYNGKAVPLQAWSGLEGSRKLRFPDFMTMAQGGGKVVSLMHQPPLPPVNRPGTHFF